ncbi:MAG: hypothetical protein QW379_05560 [Thermoplasmata archaeon]
MRHPRPSRRGEGAGRVESPKRPFRYRWRRERRGASGVVVTLLILLVAAGALSMFMAIYVPIWTKDAEARQMKRIQSQMIQLKENIDLQILAGRSSTLTNRVTLGDEGGPVFGLARTVGSLSLSPEDGEYRLGSATDPNETFGLTRGRMGFQPQNMYYPDQSYHYENGAIIVEQGGRAVMKASPHFDLRREPDGNLSASVTLISLTGVPATRSGSGDMRVKSTLSIFDKTSYAGGDWEAGRNLGLNITTAFPSVWADFFNTTLGRPETGLTGADYQVYVRPNGVDVTLFKVRELELGIAVVEIQLEM